MKMKKILSVILAVVLVASSIAVALAESTNTTETAAGDAAAVETAETAAAGETTQTVTYTTEEMLTAAMADAYARQAAYAAYAAAYTDSQSITSLTIDSQIVLLEMLLKANAVALPAAETDVTVPETKADTYQAIAEAEGNTVQLMETYLKQEALGKDAQMIFSTVLSGSYQNAVAFARKARVAQQEQAWTELMNDENTKVVVTEGTGPFGGHYKKTVYVYTNAGEQTGDTAETTDTTTEDSMSN